MRIIKRIPSLLLMLMVSALYFPLNQLLTSGYNLKTALDAYIPLVPAFTIPYLLFIPFWLAAFIVAAWKMNDRLYRAFMIASIGTTMVTTLIYFVFPTYTDRPVIEAGGWLANLLSGLYSSDNVFNAFPSEHVLYTTLIALYGATCKPGWSMALNGSVVLVVLATLLTGQHHIVDPIGGFALGWTGYRFGLWWEYGVYGMRRVLSGAKRQAAVL